MKSTMDALNFRELGVFNSREIALIFCVIFALSYCFFHKAIRLSLIKVAKTMFVQKLAIIYLLAILYSLIPIVVLYHLGFWKMQLIKDAVFWLLFSAYPTLFEVHKADKAFFSKVIKDNLKFSLIIDFITSQHTFNIFVEIATVIFSVFIGGMIAFSEREEKYKNVNLIFKVISYIIGGYILLSSMYFFAENIKNFVTLDKFEEFSLPIILGIWFVPFLYILHLTMVYESIFKALKFSIKNKDVYDFAKRKALIHFNVNTSSLKRWKDTLFIEPVNTKEDVLISFLDLRKLELIERNPPKVDILKGWSPYKSKNFLSKEGIVTNHYKKCYEDEWQAISPYVKLNNEIIGNDVAYYVTGDSTIAKQLKLVLNINSRTEEDFAVDKFLEFVHSLYNEAFNETLPVLMSQSIFKRSNKTLKVLNKKVSVHKTEHLNKAYTLAFTIKQE